MKKSHLLKYIKKLIKIIDFGLAGAIKNEKSMAGSLRYMSPEVVSGENRLTLPSIDVWSIGCILYEMLAGTYLFDGKNRNNIKVNLTHIYRKKF